MSPNSNKNCGNTVSGSQENAPRKFGLVWEDKPEEVAELCETKLPVLTEVTERHISRRKKDGTLIPDDGSNLPTHLIIEGDNYHALSVLNYTHAGKIDVIYIDPPYNTGNKDFIYNDRYIDKEDGYRHSKWLSFMEKRLVLAKDLLTESGVIFISIDDNEQAHLKMLCDAIFGEENFISTLIKQSKIGGGNDSRYIVKEHEYCFVYSNNINETKAFRVTHSEEYLKRYKEQDENGKYFWDTFARAGLGMDSTLTYEIEVPDGTKIKNHWIRSKARFEKEYKDGTVRITKTKNGWSVQFKQYLNAEGKTPRSMTMDFGGSTDGDKELKTIFGERIFDYPKSVKFLSELFSMIATPSAKILDFFAGSGTTGHAVLELNAADGGNRQFILCTNNENGIAENVTFPRIQKVIEGYADKESIPAEVRYFKTDFVEKEDGEITDAVRHELVERATDMLKVRENTFTEIRGHSPRLSNGGRKFEIFTNVAKTKYTLVIYDTSAITAAKKKCVEILESRAGDCVAVTVYIFTLGEDNYESDFAMPNWSVEPLPERILQVYRRVFDKKKKR